MRSLQLENITTSKSNNDSFFKKESNKNFFGQTGKSFFTPSYLQAKLAVNQPNDEYEQEADVMADKVVQRLASPSVDSNAQNNTNNLSIQRKCATCEQEDEEKLQTKPESSSLHNASPVIENNLTSSKGSGNPLPATTREQMESSFGSDFSNVRLHTDSSAAEMNKNLNAQAFTHGSDIYFNSGKYDTNSISGKHLLAHELTHVVQQGSGYSNTASGKVNTLFRAPEDKETLGNNLELPCLFGDYSLNEKTIGDIRVLIGLVKTEKDTFPDIESKLPGIIKQINIDNALIKKDDLKVKVCIIAPATTRFALLFGKPVLVIDPDYANIETVAHEMGHAVFSYLQQESSSAKIKSSGATNFLEACASIFLQLKDIIIENDDKTEFSANWIVDPSIWSPGSKAEHPTDPDEFFASAKAAYQLNKKALKATIAKFGKKEPKIKKPTDDLLLILSLLLEKKELPGKGIKDKAEKERATNELERVGEPSKVEETIGVNFAINMLLYPDKRPKCKN